MIKCTKINPGEVYLEKKTLYNTGYYSNKPRAILVVLYVDDNDDETIAQTVVAYHVERQAFIEYISSSWFSDYFLRIV